MWKNSRSRTIKSSLLFMSVLLLTVATRRFSSAAFVIRPGASSTRTVASIGLLPRQKSPRIRLSSQQQNDSDDNFQPTWTYAPFDPAKPNMPRTPPTPRRPFSTWNVPKSIDVPEDRLEISFVRSSGAGGQNVNKVNTKVEVRFDVDAADWIPAEVRERLKEQQANRINKDGYLSLQSQEYRTQVQNRKAAVDKLKEMLLQAWPRPKVRKQRTGISKAAKERNKEFKKKRSETKSSRGRVDF